MVTQFEKELEERQIIKQETKITIIIGLVMLASVFVYGLIAYFVKIDITIKKKALENIYYFLNFVVVLLMLAILAIRKTIYYSPKFIKDDFTLRQILQKWRSIDIILLALAETIPLSGLVISLLGMPFRRTFHFFVVSALLMIILIPLGIKVRSKLNILNKHHPGN